LISSSLLPSRISLRTSLRSASASSADHAAQLVGDGDQAGFDLRFAAQRRRFLGAERVEQGQGQQRRGEES